ncbi:MAG: hypothetical protein WDW38_001422 [Sanguina aurantia]
MNHISRVVSDLKTSCLFYEMLGFSRIHRPSLRCDGVWLWGLGLGIHLIKGNPIARQPVIDPQADHISFQAESLAGTEELLKKMGVPYAEALVEEEGLLVRQLFFHDPDYNMIEICNCDVLPIVLEASVMEASNSNCSSSSILGTASDDRSTASSIGITDVTAIMGRPMTVSATPPSCSSMMPDSQRARDASLLQPMDLSYA